MLRSAIEGCIATFSQQIVTSLKEPLNRFVPKEAKFTNFKKQILQNFQNLWQFFESLFSICKILCIWANFYCYMWPNVEKII